MDYQNENVKFEFNFDRNLLPKLFKIWDGIITQSQYHYKQLHDNHFRTNQKKSSNDDNFAEFYYASDDIVVKFTSLVI